MIGRPAENKKKAAVKKRPILNHEHQKIAVWLKNVKFRRCIFGGIDEKDVWKKLEELNGIYEAALGAERARYDALLDAVLKKRDENGQERQ